MNPVKTTSPPDNTELDQGHQVWMKVASTGSSTAPSRGELCTCRDPAYIRTLSTGSQEEKWRKSTQSIPRGECVELARLAGGNLGIRDSKNPATGYIMLDYTERSLFFHQVKEGVYDLH